MRAISDFFIQYTTGCVVTKESDCYLHGVNWLGQNTEWHILNFWPNEIQTASIAVAILLSSAVGGYKMCFL